MTCPVCNGDPTPSFSAGRGVSTFNRCPARCTGPAHVEAKRNERGAWCVYVDGRVLSTHSDHVGARVSAQQIAKAEQGGEP